MNPRLFGKVRAQKAAIRYNHPSKSVRLILVTGAYGKSTSAKLLAEVLREAGEKVACFTNLGSDIESETYEPRYDASADSIQQALAKARKKTSAVVMEVTPALERSHTLATLQCEMILATDDSSRATEVLEHPSTFVVAPHGIAVENLSASPHQLITYGDDVSSEAHIRNTTLYRKGTEVELTIDFQTNLTLSTHLLGRANARNVAAVAAAAYLLGCDMATLEEGIARLEAVSGNAELIPSESPYQIYVDRSPHADSVDLVSSSFKQLAHRRLLVACDETIDTSSLALLSERCDRVTAAGGDEAHGRYRAKNADEAAKVTLRAARKDDLVLLLGASYAADDDGQLHAATLVNSGGAEDE